MAPDSFGKYRVLRQLGQGAMGEVYLAEDPFIGRALAIKVMKSAGEEERLRFLQEARLVGGLSHPNIVVLHDFGFHEDQPYLVMELVEGVGLDQWLREQHPLSEHLVVIEGLCGALGFAHARGVLHRDLKPSNVHVTSDGRCKLMDFGIARGAESMLTATGTIMGTPAYMAPEILQDARYSVRSDVYAAGVLIYEMLARRNPYLGQSVAATLHNTLHLCPDHLCQVRPDIPAELGDAVMACLEKDPARRPESLGPLLGTLHRLPQPGQAPSLDTHSVVNLQRPAGHEKARPDPPALRRGVVIAVMLSAAIVASGGLLWWRGARRGETPTVPAASPLAVLQPSRVDGSPSPTPVAQAAHRAAPSPSGLRAPARGGEQSRSTPAPNPPPPIANPTPAPAADLPREPIKALAPEPTPEPTAASEAATPREPQRPSALLGALTPRTTHRGLTVSIEVRGSNLRPEHRVLVLRGSQAAAAIRITRQQYVDGKLLRATLLVDEDAPLGVYSVVLVDAGGVSSNALTLEVVL